MADQDLPYTLQAIARVSSAMPIEHCRAVDEAASEILRLRERVDELLEANNVFEQRCRDARAELARVAVWHDVATKHWHDTAARETEVRGVLSRFYDHVTTNAVLWTPGTDDVTHKHPIWGLVKTTLGRD